MPVLSTSQEQLVLVRDGDPILTYRVSGTSPRVNQRVGMEAITRYVDSVKKGDHLVMLYDDPKLARSIEFHYVKNGIAKGELCQYIIAKDDVESSESITRQMEEDGIKTSAHLKAGRLEFRKIGDPSKDSRGFQHGASKILEQLVEGVKSPIRMVLHVKYEFRTEDEISAHAEFERNIHHAFSNNFPGSMLCNHFVGNSRMELHRGWTRSMLDPHDCVFFVSSSRNTLSML